jgi:hypothetical protein
MKPPDRPAALRRAKLSLYLSLRLVISGSGTRIVGMSVAKTGFSMVTKKRAIGGIRSLELEAIGCDG